MKDEKLLELMWDYVRSLDADEREYIDKFVENKCDDNPYNIPHVTLAVIINELNERIYDAEAKSCGKDKKRNVVRRVLKRCINDHMRGVYYIGEKQCLTDGQVMFMFNSPIDGFKEVEGFASSESIFKQVRGYADVLELPEIATLKAKRKELKAKYVSSKDGSYIYEMGNKRTMYDFGKGLPLVDVNYLIDILEAFPECSAYWSGNNTNSVLGFRHEDGEAVLCPISKKSCGLS